MKDIQLRLKRGIKQVSVAIFVSALTCFSLPAQCQPPQSILLILPHPDDETMIRSFITRFVENGNQVSAIYVTHGEGGKDQRWLTQPPLGNRAQQLAHTRSLEMQDAAKKYHFENYFQLDFVDEPLRDPITQIPTRDYNRFLRENGPWDLNLLKNQIQSIAQKIQPDLLITFYPGQPDSHAHHQAISKLVTELYDAKKMGSHVQGLYGFYEHHVVRGVNEKKFSLKLSEARIHFPPATLSKVSGPYLEKAYGEAGSVGALAHVSQSTGETGAFFQDWKTNPDEVLAPIHLREGTLPLEQALGNVVGTTLFSLTPTHCSRLLAP